MLGFPCVPGLRSEPDQQSRKCASDGWGKRPRISCSSAVENTGRYTVKIEKN